MLILFLCFLAVVLSACYLCHAIQFARRVKSCAALLEKDCFPQEGESADEGLRRVCEEALRTTSGNGLVPPLPAMVAIIASALCAAGILVVALGNPGALLVMPFAADAPLAIFGTAAIVMAVIAGLALVSAAVAFFLLHRSKARLHARIGEAARKQGYKTVAGNAYPSFTMAADCVPYDMAYGRYRAWVEMPRFEGAKREVPPDPEKPKPRQRNKKGKRRNKRKRR